MIYLSTCTSDHLPRHCFTLLWGNVPPANITHAKEIRQVRYAKTINPPMPFNGKD